MSKLSVIMFCTQSGGTSHAPGKANNILRLQAIPSKESVDNAKVADEAANFSGTLNVDGLLAHVADEFTAGQQYVVTIEPVASGVQQAPPASP